MNIQKIFSAALVAAGIAAIYFPAEKVSAQAQDGNPYSIPIEMVVTGGTTEGVETSHHGMMDLVGLRPNEQIAVTLNVPTSWGGNPVGIAPLDGGVVAPEGVEVKGDGSVNFTFEGGDTPGLYRVLVTIGGDEYQLQFYVVKPTHLEGLCP
jgi:hypothetical protein